MNRLENEKELFALIARSDETAFTKVFHHYNRRLYPFVLKMLKSESLAEEIIQSIFIRLWHNRHRLDQVEDPRAYIFTMAANKTRDQLKKLANENRLLKEVEQQVSGMISNETEEMIFLKESEALLAKAVEKLPAQRQKIYRLSREEGKSYDEIAKELNISVNTVRNQLVEALRYIRKAMQNATGFLTAFITLFDNSA